MARRPKPRFADAAGIAGGSSSAAARSGNHPDPDSDDALRIGFAVREAWQARAKNSKKADKARMVIEARAAGVSVQQCAKIAGVTVRTVYRYLAAK